MARITPPKGGFGQGKAKGRPKWRSPDGKSLFEWDSLHGEVGWYDKRGKHLGALDAMTGVQVKPAIRGRTIDV
jgi:hypothetical protein